MFFRKLKNMEVRRRDWMIYSQTSGKIYCIYCKFFGDKENNFCKDLKNWKHEERIAQHEISSSHQKSARLFLTRSRIEGRIGTALEI